MGISPESLGSDLCCEDADESVEPAAHLETKCVNSGFGLAQRQPGEGRVLAVNLRGLDGVGDGTVLQDLEGSVKCWQHGGQSHTCESTPPDDQREEENVLSVKSIVNLLLCL